MTVDFALYTGYIKTQKYVLGLLPNYHVLCTFPKYFDTVFGSTYKREGEKAEL